MIPLMLDVSSLPLRGREREHDTIAGALAAGVSIAVDGGAGSGRSRLLQAAAGLADGLGLRPVLVDDAHALSGEELQRRLAGAPVTLISLRWPLAGPDASSWRAWPQLIDLKNVPTVDGATARWPSTA